MTNRTGQPSNPVADRKGNNSPVIQMVKDMALQSNDFKGSQESPRKSLVINQEDGYEAVRDTGETPSENHISTPNMFLYGPRGSHMNSRAKLEKVAHLDKT